MKRVTLFWSLLALVAVILAGCSSTMISSAPTAAPAATSAAQAAATPEAAMPTAAAAPAATQASTPAAMTTNVTLGLALSTLNNPFFVTLRDGAQKEADAEGVKLVVADAQNDPAKQASQIEDFITQKVSAILLNPTDSNAVVPSVKKANDAKIPILTLDRSAASGDIVSFIASNNVEGGKMAADFLCQAIGDKGNVVELQGIAGTSAARDRGQGFDEEMAAKCPDAKIVAKQPADFDRAKGNSVFANILTAQPDIAGVFAQNDEMVLGAIQAAEAANRTGITFVGFDGIPDGIQAIKDGKLAADVAQQPAEMGKLGVQNAVKYLNGEKVDASIAVPLQLLTKDNINTLASTK
jgi:ribose transport system substrate-binding protein